MTDETTYEHTFENRAEAARAIRRLVECSDSVVHRPHTFEVRGEGLTLRFGVQEADCLRESEYIDTSVFPYRGTLDELWTILTRNIEHPDTIPHLGEWLKAAEEREADIAARLPTRVG